MRPKISAFTVLIKICQIKIASAYMEVMFLDMGPKSEYIQGILFGTPALFFKTATAVLNIFLNP